MSKLSISLTGMPDNFRIEAAVPRAELRPEGSDDLSVDAIQVSGTMRRSGEDYLFEGTVAGTYESPCDRCLDPASMRVDVPVFWTFRRDLPPELPPDDDEDLDSDEFDDDSDTLYGFEGSEIDLSPRVWEELVLAAPFKFLCRADCAGLCPNCGANLNRDTCACSKEQPISNTGLAGLGKLLQDLKGRPAKE